VNISEYSANHGEALTSPEGGGDRGERSAAGFKVTPDLIFAKNTTDAVNMVANAFLEQAMK
jgi:hypothetical protein